MIPNLLLVLILSISAFSLPRICTRVVAPLRGGATGQHDMSCIYTGRSEVALPLSLEGVMSAGRCGQDFTVQSGGPAHTGGVRLHGIYARRAHSMILTPAWFGKPRRRKEKAHDVAWRDRPPPLGFRIFFERGKGGFPCRNCPSPYRWWFHVT